MERSVHSNMQAVDPGAHTTGDKADREHPDGQDSLGEHVIFRSYDPKRDPPKPVKKLGWHDDSEILEINEADEDDEAGSKLSYSIREKDQSVNSQKGLSAGNPIRSRKTSKQHVNGTELTYLGLTKRASLLRSDGKELESNREIETSLNRVGEQMGDKAPNSVRLEAQSKPKNAVDPGLPPLKQNLIPKVKRPSDVPIIELKGLKPAIKSESQHNPMSAEQSDYNITISEGSRKKLRLGMAERGKPNHQSENFASKPDGQSVELIDSGGSILAGEVLEENPYFRFGARGAQPSQKDNTGYSQRLGTDPISIKDEANSDRLPPKGILTFGPKNSQEAKFDHSASSFKRIGKRRITNYLRNLSVFQQEIPQPKSSMTRLGDLYVPPDSPLGEDGILKRVRRPMVLQTTFEQIELGATEKDGNKTGTKDSASDIRLTDTSLGTVDSGMLFPEQRFDPNIRPKTGFIGCIHRYAATKTVKTLHVCLIILSMFGDDTRRMCLDASQDKAVDVVLGLVMGIFFLEILFAIWTKGWSYFRGGEILVDLLATSSMLLDITIVSENFLASFQK